MSGKQYLKNQLPVILINLLGMLALALFLIASDNPIQTVLFILAVWSIVLVLSLLAFYFSRKKYLNKLLNMTEHISKPLFPGSFISRITRCGAASFNCSIVLEKSVTQKLNV